MTLLQLEIEKRIKENERPAASTGNKLLKKKGGNASHKYALMAFSHSCHNFSPTDKKLRLCSDYASSTDFLQKEKDVLQSYKHALLYNRHDKTSFVDHCAFISSFIEQLQNDALDVATLKNTERSIRDFVSCLVVSEVPAGAALKVGELIGRYATVCFRLSDGHDQMNGVNNAISTFMTMLPISAESIASFVTGYIEYAMGRMNEEPRNKNAQRVFVSTVTALSRAVCNNSAIQHLQVPAVDKNSERKKAAATQFNDAKARMTTLMNWATAHVPSHSTKESTSQNESDDSQNKTDGDNDEEVADQSEEDNEIRSTRKRKNE